MGDWSSSPVRWRRPPPKDLHRRADDEHFCPYRRALGHSWVDARKDPQRDHPARRYRHVRRDEPCLGRLVMVRESSRPLSRTGQSGRTVLTFWLPSAPTTKQLPDEPRSPVAGRWLRQTPAAGRCALLARRASSVARDLSPAGRCMPASHRMVLPPASPPRGVSRSAWQPLQQARRQPRTLLEPPRPLRACTEALPVSGVAPIMTRHRVGCPFRQAIRILAR